tara:strand:+ start:2532 stop:3221 length:690 start_codon:yes stop_codon:yes gene_type:complete
MKYYSLQNSANKKILGKHDPYKKVIHTVSVNDSIHLGKHFLGLVNYVPEIPILELKSEAKILDLMIGPSAIGFTNKLIVSSKLKEILKENNVNDIQFFEINLIQNNKNIEGYSVMHPIKENLDSIDFNNSEIFISSSIQPIEKVNIKSVLHFKQLREELQTNGYNGRSIAFLFIEKLILKKEIERNLIYLNHLRNYGPFLVSEKLKNEIEKNNCTGIEFLPLGVLKQDI